MTTRTFARGVLVLLLASCHRRSAAVEVEPSPLPVPLAAATARPSATPSAPAPLFPEDATLAGVVAPGDLAFDQETWTGAAEWQQHCHEWGLEPARKDTVIAYLNDVLAARGVHFPDKARAKGLVVAEGDFKNGLVARPPLIKVIVCTEGVAPRSAHEAFAERLLEHAVLPRAELGPPDLAWQRMHSTGEIEVGFRWQNADPAVAARVVESARGDDKVSAKLRGKDLWWSNVVR